MDIIEFIFLDNFDNICYVCIQLNNKIKYLQIKHFKNKNKNSLLTFFKYSINKFKYKNNKYICIRINNNNKYINKVF